MANEAKTIRDIGSNLKKDGRFYTNIHGSGMANKNGVFDYVSIDSDGKFLGIEAKSSRGKVYPNQMRRCREILEKKGRAIIVYPGNFDIDDIDRHKLPKYNYVDEDTKLPKETMEIVLEGGETYGKE
ncbi:hypothetical protein [Staphylococcus pettenkoferi]|uniref:hypothetical protein n=1 Tax=Staphylococcus pettenkoferi TaxID=170573 RepID=UPI002556DED1|nr:hypothetical protein [Staphylococcus pettenkoferi]MDK7284285.1 hypothetical protein [Staphylococcus pettenkoferi]